MKTREEIQQEYVLKDAERRERFRQERLALNAREDNERGLLDAARNAALAELDDPMARLIAAGRRAVDSHIDSTGTCGWCDIYAELRDAIDYAEQRRAQG